VTEWIISYVLSIT